MNKEFIPYEQALALKELGFDEPCVGCYDNFNIWIIDRNSKIEHKNSIYSNNELYKGVILAPLYQQAFRWFREKYGLYHSIGLDSSLENDVNCDYQIINHNQSISELETGFKSYEEAELACLIKLINICKN